ncbi:stage III sporulation protein SpoIIIAB [Halalkalibacterium halodurans]|uniref:Mutants block sporulation after engulfment n=2 Tax=Halalkalibacterium halodurans TaxID=86665 RepID=Q9K954_HALH5|nr:stage III sporulation protein SpoIIIAB [Halalkalibacterium halodurans]MED3646883.1 stage III sporulation protein SpoIIIAB [Halalkalibacterium halodurans]MED4080216.1 stage III sporulation protein SpoIIIAB [Halalkalibacterium halodurans]MED4084716.1 stage III sporulation protein SpoIIIAB [Halalkalibacterium halodurans]MED4103904.1 stage III sporulation protein SpoIIIAB [Halalkalibacterium halodurans]MED4109024.1 stage III sporulation protein SpoIIIAB [Halalkalibacterium halodurans]
MKLLGAIFILMATTWAGFELARRLHERPRQLRQLKVALQSLEAEMVYGLTPLAEATGHIAAQMPKPVSYLFEHFSYRLKEKEETVYDAWEAAINETWKYTALLASEREVILQFGATLGQHDREQQQKQVRLTLAHLEREEGEARDKQYRYERMMKSLGVLAGLLIILMML